MSKNILKPIVSVLCITYNQKKYIRQCLDGFLMQKTNFKYEILINDDASNDGTVEILKEYQRKYPKMISVYTHSVNQYSKNADNMYVRYLFSKAKGKYVALCDGDDYWTDPNKLQRQVDFLETNPDYSMCFHPVKVIFENHEEPDSIYPINNNKDNFTLEELLKSNFIQTNSVMYRKQTYDNMESEVMPGDWYMHLYHAQFGKIGFINEIMSIYRRSKSGIWWNAYSNRDEFWKKYYINHLMFARELLSMYGSKQEYAESLFSLVNSFIASILDVDRKYNTNLFKDANVQFPDLFEYYVVGLLDHFNANNNENESLKNNQKIMKEENDLIKSSILWKIRSKIIRLLGKKSV